MWENEVADESRHVGKRGADESRHVGKQWRKKRNTLENRAYDKLSAGKITNEKNIQKYYERTRHDEFPYGYSHP